MSRGFEERPILSFTNANKALVVEQLDALRREWAGFLEEARAWPDSPDYDPNTCTEVIKDGFENIRRHDRLREKTLTFIGNNFTGYAFLFENWPRHPHEDNTDRRRNVIPGWIHRLDQLGDCIEYARAPDGYWTAKSKQLVDRIIELGPDRAVDFAVGYLKNPGG